MRSATARSIHAPRARIGPGRKPPMATNSQTVAAQNAKIAQSLTHKSAQIHGCPSGPAGGCTTCCKLPAAPAPLNKPAGVWCQHCDKGKGCRNYAERPADCRSFMCLWKVMPDFPDELRPDRCKVMWTMTEDGYDGYRYDIRRRWRLGHSGVWPSSSERRASR